MLAGRQRDLSPPGPSGREQAPIYQSRWWSTAPPRCGCLTAAVPESSLNPARAIDNEMVLTPGPFRRALQD